MSAIQILSRRKIFINTNCSNYITYTIARNKNFQLHVVISQRNISFIGIDLKSRNRMINLLYHIQRIDLENFSPNKTF